MYLLRHAGYKFPVGGLIILLKNLVAVHLVDGIQPAAGPCHLDGMAHGALHLAGGGIVFPGDAGIELLGDAIDDVVVVHHHAHGFPQVLVALDVGGDADGVRCHVHGVNALMFIKLL